MELINDKDEATASGLCGIWEEEWLDVAERRWQEIETGKVECIPAEEAMKSIRASLEKRL
ncbi:MAG: addiction module protein [bacterium]|nr:addiction module protein [bacterium]